jgi:hypothetical protein
MLSNPWQRGPSELLGFALEYLHRDSDFAKRISFLMLDIGVETVMKTFLTLPEEVTKAEGKYNERKTAAEGNFHELVRGVAKAAGPRLEGLNLQHIQFYHDLRNKLYHQGNGITIPTDKAQHYAELAIDLFKRLLGVDLTDLLLAPEIEAKRQLQLDRMHEQITVLQDRITNRCAELLEVVESVIEGIAPALLLPSFRRQFASIRSEYVEIRCAGFDSEGEPVEWAIMPHSVEKHAEFTDRILGILDSRVARLLAPLDRALRWGSWPREELLHFLLAETVVMGNPNNDWYGTWNWASDYPNTTSPQDKDELMEDYLSRVIVDADHHLASIAGVRASIEKWLTGVDS